MAFAATEPCGQRLGVVPGDVDDRVVITLGKAGIAPGIARIAAFEGVAARAARGVVGRVVAIAACAVGFGFGAVARGLDEAAELPHGDFVLAQVEVVADAHRVHRRFVGERLEALAFKQGKVARQRFGVFGAAHGKAAGGNAHERHAQRVAPYGDVPGNRLLCRGGAGQQRKNAGEGGREIGHAASPEEAMAAWTAV